MWQLWFLPLYPVLPFTNKCRHGVVTLSTGMWSGSSSLPEQTLSKVRGAMCYSALSDKLLDKSCGSLCWRVNVPPSGRSRDAETGDRCRGGGCGPAHSLHGTFHGWIVMNWTVDTHFARLLRLLPGEAFEMITWYNTFPAVAAGLKTRRLWFYWETTNSTSAQSQMSSFIFLRRRHLHKFKFEG